MLTGKQRSYLKGLANGIEPVVYIGKNELTDAVIDEIEGYLSVHELVKVKVQESAEIDIKQTANDCAQAVRGEFVQAIGRRFVIYRENKENKEIFLPK